MSDPKPVFTEADVLEYERLANQTESGPYMQRLKMEQLGAQLIRFVAKDARRILALQRGVREADAQSDAAKQRLADAQAAEAQAQQEHKASQARRDQEHAAAVARQTAEIATLQTKYDDLVKGLARVEAERARLHASLSAA
jgi:hypothetical protein